MARTRDSRQLDLQLWADLCLEIEDARAEVERAERARNTARRRYHYAPVGTKSVRHQALLDATAAALEAGRRLTRLEREVR